MKHIHTVIGNRTRGVCGGRNLGVPLSEGGAALLLVIWVSALFSLILTGFAFSMRVEMDATRNFRDRAQATLLAESGITQALADLANAKPSAPFRPARIGPRRLGPGTYQVVVTNEDGKISLNHASETVLRRLLKQSGVQDVQLQETIAASIVDWRDPDDVERIGGAESEYYRSGGRPYSAKNGPFKRVEELLSVRGMTRDILYGNIQNPSRREALQHMLPENREFAPGEYLGIRPYLTAFGSGKIDYATAELEVLLASDLPADKLREILRGREMDAPSGNPNQPPAPAAGLGSNPRIYRVESIGRIENSPIVSQIHAIVTREGTMRAPRFRVMSWQEIGE